MPFTDFEVSQTCLFGREVYERNKIHYSNFPQKFQWLVIMVIMEGRRAGDSFLNGTIRGTRQITEKYTKLILIFPTEHRFRHP